MKLRTILLEQDRVQQANQKASQRVTTVVNYILKHFPNLDRGTLSFAVSDAFSELALNKMLQEGINDRLTKLRFAYTDFGRFYATYLYMDGKQSYQAKISSPEEIKNLLSRFNITYEVPGRYTPQILDKISQQLQDKGIEVEYDDTIDVS